MTALQVEYKELNLGKEFHYVGVQLLPGVWNGEPDDIRHELVNEPYSGNLPLVKINKAIQNLNFKSTELYFSNFILDLIKQKLIIENTTINQILQNLEQIHSVSDMTNFTHLSARQLQRKIKQAVHLSPHDFLKILRIQQSFTENYLDFYSDQSHFIKSFKKITGYTPEKFSKKFNF